MFDSSSLIQEYFFSINRIWKHIFMGNRIKIMVIKFLLSGKLDHYIVILVSSITRNWPIADQRPPFFNFMINVEWNMLMIDLYFTRGDSPFFGTLFVKSVCQYKIAGWFIISESFWKRVEWWFPERFCVFGIVFLIWQFKASSISGLGDKSKSNSQ